MFHYLPSQSQALVCISTPSMYPQSGYFIVSNKSNNNYFQTSNCISHNDHEDKSKNQQTINGTITKSVGCFVHEFWDIEYCEGEGGRGVTVGHNCFCRAIAGFISFFSWGRLGFWFFSRQKKVDTKPCIFFGMQSICFSFIFPIVVINKLEWIRVWPVWAEIWSSIYVVRV